MASQLVLTLAGERADQDVRGRQRRHLGFGSVRRDERGREGGEAEHQQPGLPFSMLYGAEPRSLGPASSALARFRKSAETGKGRNRPLAVYTLRYPVCPASNAHSSRSARGMAG